MQGNEAEPFLEWALETVLPRQARKLASAIEEKDAALALINDEEHKRSIIRKTLPRVRVIISKIETLV